MKKFAMILCGAVLASTANAAPKAVPKVRSELELRVLNKTPTKIFVSGGETVSVPPQILYVSASSFTYKRGGTNGSEFGRTILKGNASVTWGNKGKSPVVIRAAEIEVETALTEIWIDAGSIPADLAHGPAWKYLADALKSMPYSPRFRLDWNVTALSSHAYYIAIYDRRSGNLYQSGSFSSMDMEPYFRQSTKKNITDKYIESQAKTF